MRRQNIARQNRPPRKVAILRYHNSIGWSSNGHAGYGCSCKLQLFKVTTKGWKYHKGQKSKNSTVKEGAEKGQGFLDSIIAAWQMNKE